ncbi:hypothetical protein H7U18_03270 [Klebsiella pneumoniae]|uniref:Uncharacterized protein n=1 Tax=Klebsiella pneumoniae TaxID=573 RepID=A0A923J8D6_KLEPN|nr:hypothetical protein [Klebsiella pneumoniae]
MPLALLGLPSAGGDGPGWIRTELGGADAPLTIEETIPRPVNVLLDKRQRPGLEYLDYRGRTVPR